MVRTRKRSNSGNSYKELSNNLNSNASIEGVHCCEKLLQVEKVRQWMKLVLGSREDNSGKSIILHESGNFALLAAYLMRTKELDDYSNSLANESTTKTPSNKALLQEQLLLEKDVESHYTALHWAIYRGDLATTLLLLRHTWSTSLVSTTAIRPRQPRPMEFFEHSAAATQKPALWEVMVTARDAQGCTPGQLLATLQIAELGKCRAFLNQGSHTANNTQADSSSGETDDQDELSLLNNNLRWLSIEQDNQELQHNMDRNGPTTASSGIQDGYQYGCEVVTFGGAHPCTLGVGTDTIPGAIATSRANTNNNHSNTANAAQSSLKPSFRPQRVEAFALSQVGRSHGAIAVAAATHHTLVLNRAGQVFSFGLGKGGRLGNGSERHCPLPNLVTFPIHRKVTAIAAAENHSVAVTENGQVWAWGSNRFGQLGIVNANNQASLSTNNTTATCVLVPRRVDGLKDVHIRTVAAGERHSVALSSSGHVYVWGDNSSGQLGLPPRKHHIAKVQIVSALTQKTALAIAASAFATLVLTAPPKDKSTLPVNVIYSWGHGNHVPSKVHFSGRSQNNANNNTNWEENHRHKQYSGNLINPIAIACARYHNAAITEHGLVYTWGFHTETLGTANTSSMCSPSTTSKAKKQSPFDNSLATPQLVEAMLPENGGGFAVSVSASENHTAVLTDTGALYTWGATHGPNILGHEGVRWQPDPKKVPGLYRGVAVASAKEHFVVLVGTTFPPTPLPSELERPPSLQDMAARCLTEFVDLFNVLPILISAERAQNETLIQYCLEFCQRNLDAVLNLGQRSIMDCYLTEQLQANVFPILDEYEKKEERDARCHPIIKDFVLLGSERKMASSYPMNLSSFDDWLSLCMKRMESLPGTLFLQKLIKKREISKISNYLISSRLTDEGFLETKRVRSVSFGEPHVAEVSECSLSGLEYVAHGQRPPLSDGSICGLEERQKALTKEVRAIRKRLAQISKLESGSGILSLEQQEKVHRKIQLQSDLAQVEDESSRLEKQLRELSSKDENVKAEDLDAAEKFSQLHVELAGGQEKENKEAKKLSLRCELCCVSCSDESSYSLHMSGRKHRNRVMQNEQEDRERTVAMVAAQRQIETLKNSSCGAHVSTVAFSPSNPWKNEPTSPIPRPSYNLPPPPHGVPFSLVDSSHPSEKKEKALFSLKDIMATESRNVSEKKLLVATKLSSSTVAATKSGLSDKPVTMTSIKAPPAGSQNSVRLQLTNKEKVRSRSSAENRTLRTACATASPLILSAGSLPDLESPPTGTVSDSRLASPMLSSLNATNTNKPDAPQPSSFLLGDYIGQLTTTISKKEEQLKPRTSNSGHVWGQPQTNLSGTGSCASSPTKFVTILNEELAVKEKQCSAYAEKGKWFVGPREKVGSLKDIQEIAEKERSDRLFVEEQFRIEKIILEEIQKQNEEKKHTKKRKSARRIPKTGDTAA